MNHLKLVALITMMFFTSMPKAQDIIITQKKDTINCKITKDKAEYIHFVFKHKDEVRNTLISRKDVLFYKKGYFQETELTSEDLDEAVVKLPSFRIAVNGGYSYRIAKVLDEYTELEPYIRELKKGVHWSVSGIGYIDESLGIGLKYSCFNSENSMKNVEYTNIYGVREQGNISDDIRIHFIGPVISARLYNHNKTNSWILSYGLGYMHYVDHTYVGGDFKISGGTLGQSYDIGYDVGLSKNLALGFQLSFLSGKITKIKVSNGYDTQSMKLDEDSQEGLGRFDFSVGLRLNL